ncbi:MAG: biotin/lipoyl-binding protein [Proteobacteria bacterium]|nr:biotin/lipoyl-binding protein [Pseudomonadota bacterium]
MRKYEVTINEKPYTVLVKKYTPSQAELEINGKPYSVKLDQPVTAVGTGMPAPSAIPAAPVVQAPTMPAAPTPAPVAPAPPAAKTASQGKETITAPIPGSILEVVVKEGDTVQAGQALLKMEAMKMENEINCTVDGTVLSIMVKVGDAVSQGHEMIVIG